MRPNGSANIFLIIDYCHVDFGYPFCFRVDFGWTNQLTLFLSVVGQKVVTFLKYFIQHFTSALFNKSLNDQRSKEKGVM